MKKIIRKRGGGKTTELIKMSAETDAHIVCQNMIRANYIAKYAAGLNLKIPFPITYLDILDHKMIGAFPCVKYLLDDADDFIKFIFDKFTRFDTLKAITLTDNKEKQKCGQCKENDIFLGCHDCNIGLCGRYCMREHFRDNHVAVVEFYQHREIGKNAIEFSFRPRCVKCKQDVRDTEEHVCQP